MDFALGHALSTLGLRAGGFDKEQLRAAYMREALRVHSDKGGSDEAFRRLTHSYKRLKKFLLETAPVPDHAEMRKAFMDAARTEPVLQQRKMDPAAFNAAFEREHMVRPIGHGEWLAADVPQERMCPEKLADPKDFGRAFSDMAKRNSLSLVVRQAPVILSAQCSLAAGYMKGDDNVDDYSGSSRNVSYADVRLAHDQPIIDQDEAEAFARLRANDPELLDRLKKAVRAKAPKKMSARGSKRDGGRVVHA
jgi:hypothetical protein